MKTFKIIFQDKDDNDLWMSMMRFEDMTDAKKYAILTLANTTWQDAVKFKITEH